MMKYYLMTSIFLSMLLLFGCAPKKGETMNADQTQQTQTADNNGTLKGRVTIGPICPVERVDQPCDPPPEMYANHHLVLLAQDGKTKIQEIKTDAKGFYKTEAPAGDYLLDYVPHDIGIGVKPPKPVHVEAGQTTKFDLDIDTGIR